MVNLQPAERTDRDSDAEEDAESDGQPTTVVDAIESSDADGSHSSDSDQVERELDQRSIPASAEQYPASEWLDNRRLLIVAAGSLVCLLLLAILYTLYYVQAVLFPITLAVILKLIFSPVVRRLNKWHVPHWASAGIVVGAICGLCIAGIAMLSGPAAEWMEDAPAHLQKVERELWSIKEPIEKVTDAGEKVDELANMDEGSEIAVEVKQPGIVASVRDTTAEVLVGIFLTLVLLYFLLAGADRLLEKLVELAPAWRHKRSIVQMARDVQQSMSSYLFATTCINVVLGIVIGFGMWLAGLPNPVLWGVMACCLNFIPYFGCIIGAGIVFVVGLVSLDSAGQAAWAPVIYICINAVEGYFITPAILGRSISLSPLAILVSMILWGWIWDVPGMLIAVPILAAMKIACDHIQPLQPLGKLIGR